MSEPLIRRLGPQDAEAIVHGFTKVYGYSYANEIFNDPIRLSSALASGTVSSVGAMDGKNQLIAHMAMTHRVDAIHVELGNTIVTPQARGTGLAWKVGDALTSWAEELGYSGYLHYPTTDHKIMQRRSVLAGHETGLMLGYIPNETNDKGREILQPLRGATTIVYEALTKESNTLKLFLPERYDELIRDLAAPTNLSRRWERQLSNLPPESDAQIELFKKRSLARLTVEKVGQNLGAHVSALICQAVVCHQVDFFMSDSGIGQGVELSKANGAIFCGWLPGLQTADILRMQWIDLQSANLELALANPVAQRIFTMIQKELER